ncbi:M28 family peptidase [Candidatus Nitrospira bockiana]
MAPSQLIQEKPVFWDYRLAETLEADVRALAGEIGERNTVRFHNLDRAAAFITGSLESIGLAVRPQTYEVDGHCCQNIQAELPGAGDAEDIIVIGAHYDSIRGGPGADDNASGVAALLGLARAFAGTRLSRTVRFVAFVNEERPYLRTRAMGSVVYASQCRQRREQVIGMLSLETLGYYPGYDRPQSDPLPARLLRPVQGSFVALVSNLASRRLLHVAAHTFRRASEFPVRAFVLPGFLPGVKSSDHWSFWQQGYPAIMVTDTAPLRYPFYHTAHDTPDKLSYRALAQVVIGLRHVITRLATGDSAEY